MMSKADQSVAGPSHAGSSSRVMADTIRTTSTIKTESRTEPVDQSEVYLSSDDEDEEDEIEEEKMKIADVLMDIKHWVRIQQKFFAPNPTAVPISEERYPTSSRIARKFLKLVMALDDVVDVLDDNRRRGYPLYEMRRAQRLRELVTATATVPEIIDCVQDEERSEPIPDPPATPRPSTPTPPVTPQRSISNQCETRRKSTRIRRPILKPSDSTTFKATSGKKMSSKTKRHRCHICRRTFSTKLNLISHRSNHRKEEEKTVAEKRFRCDQCGKKYSQRGPLRVHKRSHSANPRPFNCEECGKAFTTKQSMLIHKKRVHQRLKDVDFPQCPKKFRTKCDMRTHLNTVHLYVPLPCPHCNKSFTKKGSLRNHMKKFHPS